MTIKAVFLSLVLALAGSGSLLAVFGQDEDVRGAFMTTRPKATGSASGSNSGSNTKPSRRRPKTGGSSSSGGTTSPKSGGSNPSTGNPAPVNTARIGLGLTLFMRDSNGLGVRVDPGREFRKGDHVRFGSETSADGYLYVFNTTDGGQPVMIYPDTELDEGGNYFQAHVPFEIPSATASDERLRWLTFDEHAGAERLYFVFTREPLKGVPIEDDLLSLCREKETACPWHPQSATWTAIQNEMNEPVKIAKADSSGSMQTAAEHRAATRGIGLNRDDPEPSLIMLTSSTTKNILVVSLSLIHISPAASDSSEELQ